MISVTVLEARDQSSDGTVLDSGLFNRIQIPRGNPAPSQGTHLNGHQNLSIAVLTENQDDVALINGALRDAGHAAQCHWVSKPSKLEETLGDNTIELLILDIDTYSESVRQVIKQRDHFHPELPVIAWQRDADEAAIEAAMREGACDLVSPGSKGRLQSVVARELRALRIERALHSTINSTAEYKKQLRDYMQASDCAIALVQEGIVSEVNEAWVSLFRAASVDEVAGLPLMDNFEKGSQAAIKGALIAAVNGKWQAGEKLDARTQIMLGDTDEVQLEFTKYVFDDGPCVKVSISPPQRSEVEPTKLVHDALQRDPATLLFHRNQFLERAAKRLRKKPTSGLHVLAYVRIDNFEKVCKKVGYVTSEDIIVQFAETVRKRMHPRDIAGRFEGTSLLVLLERGSTRDAEVWANQLCEQVRQQTFDVGDRSTQLTCTVGVCGANDVFENVEQFVGAAISAHRQGKAAGGNQAFVSEAADEDARLRQADAIWIRHLRAALMEDRFRLAQLPIAGLRSDGVEMYDLLVRMLDEQGNSILPSEFLPAAERNYLMKNIDRWMIKNAIKFCQSSEADRVFVRLSKQSILDAGTGGWMEAEFDQQEFDCSRLVIQVPECDAAKHIKQTSQVVKQLRKMGIGFALEHFGIDRDKLQILDILHPDYIKVDGEFMHSLVRDTDVQENVGQIVAAASERNIKSIAERVENANVMAVLFQLGLDYMQGHYVHEPEVVLQDTYHGTHASLAAMAAAHAS